MTVLSPNDSSVQVISPASTLRVPMSCPREAHSSTTIVSHLVHEAQEDIEKGSYSDSGFSSDYLREDSQVERSKSKKNLSTTSAISPHNPPTITVRLVTTDVDETPIFPVAQSQECHQPTSKTPALPRGDIVHTIATARVPPAPSEDTDFPCNVFLVDAPAPIIRSATPANHPARFDSTVQLAFCASLLPKGNLLLASESSYASTPTSGESKNAWLNAIHEDPLVPTHIRWLISKIVAEFIENASMASAAISEVVILGPFLCREDYRSLLSCLIMRFDMAALLNVDLLRGLVQLVQCTPINYLTDNDLFCVLASFRKRLESTHTSSREHVYQLVFAVSKILEVMVASDFKGQSRQRDHQPLLAVLRGLKGVEDDVLLKFQVDYAYQTLLHLPDDETSCQVFLRRALSILVGVSIISCLFMMDATITLAAVNFLQQVVCNTIGAVYFSIDDHNFQGTTQRASQATERVRRSKKKTWVSTLQAGQIFVREGRLVEFNTLISNAPCRFEVNFLCGVCLILEDIAVGQLWDVTSKFSALDFLGELYKVEAGLKMDVKIQRLVVSILSQISKKSWPRVSEHAGALLDNLQGRQLNDTDDCHLLHIHLPLPSWYPLLSRVQDIPNVEYDLDCMKFQRLREALFPISIPLRAKVTPSRLDNGPFLLMDRVRDFLESDCRVLLLLGDSGSGKSMFCRQLERELWNDYKVGRRVPLFINLSSIDQPESDLIRKHLCDHNNLSLYSAQEIEKNRQLVLICDGYDESRLTTNLYTKNRLSHLQVKMVVSCRNTFLSRDYDGLFRPYGDDKFHDTSSNLFEEVTVLPFTDSDIHDFITQFVMDPKAAAFLGYISVESQDNYLKKLFVIPNLMELVKNPFLLTLALKALPSLPVDALHCSDLKSIQQDLYHGFTKEWIRVSKERLNGARLSQEVREVFVELLETDFFWRVKDYSKRLANAIYHRQNGRPVVEYTHKRDKETWKAEFFGGDIERKLLREASPLTRAGMRHWFIHKSLLDFFFSLAIFDPDDCHDDSDDDRDDDCGAGRGNSGDGDDNTFHNSRSGGLHDNGGNSSASSRSSSSSGESGESVGSSDGRGSSSSGGSGSPSGNNDTPGGSSRFPSDSSGSGAGEDGSNGDRDDSQQRKEDFRSKRKTRKNRSRTSITGEHMSKFNFFKEPAVLFFLEMRARTDARFRKLLFLAIEESRLSVGPNLAAANAITILLKSGESFLKVDLDGVYVPYDYMLEKRLESPEQSECLTGSDLVIALSALDVPGPPQMSNIDPQSTPSSLVEPHHPIITQSCTSCPSPITSTPIRSKPLRPSYRFPGVDLPFSTFAVQIKPILGQFGLHPLSEQATVNPYEADRDISNSMTMISRNGEDIRLQPLQRGPTGRILQVKAHYHPQSEQYVVLWDDILELFPDATTVLNGTLVLTWARDAQLNYIMPRCIKYQQGKVLEVVTSQQQLTQENTTKMAATTIPERPIDLLKLPTEAEESKDEDESEDDMQALPHAMRRSWRVLREVDMHSQKMTEVDMHSQKMTEVDMHSQKTTEVGAYSRWGLSRRRRSDSGPPSFQGFRDVFEPVDTKDSIKYVLITQHPDLGRIILWSNILMEFPQAHLIMYRNNIIPMLRDGTTLIEPLCIEANRELVYDVLT